MQNPSVNDRGFYSSELLHFGGLAGGGAVGRNRVDQRVHRGLVLGLLAGGGGSGSERARIDREIFCFSLSMLVIFASTTSPTLSTSEGWPMRRLAIWEMWIRPSVPGSTSAKAPKGISLTILTFAISPTWRWVSVNTFQGFRFGIAVAEGDLVVLLIEVDDVNVDLVADVQDIRKAADAVPADLRHVDHTVDAADINERAVRGHGLDHALVVLADLDLVPDLLGTLPCARGWPRRGWSRQHACGRG